MVSDFVTVESCLMLPWMILDATQYLEYSKENYWASDSMIDMRFR